MKVVNFSFLFLNYHCYFLYLVKKNSCSFKIKSKNFGTRGAHSSSLQDIIGHIYFFLTRDYTYGRLELSGDYMKSSFYFLGEFIWLITIHYQTLITKHFSVKFLDLNSVNNHPNYHFAAVTNIYLQNSITFPL